MIHDDERETRAEVCEECEHLLHAMPLTCSLVKRQKQIGPLPCPHALRAMLYDVEAVCPHPDEAWANRWKAADVLRSASEPQAQSVSEAAPSDDASPVSASANAETANVTATSTNAGGAASAVKTAEAKINPEAVERRAGERQSRRRGVRHEAFYVQRHPAGPVAQS